MARQNTITSKTKIIWKIHLTVCIWAFYSDFQSVQSKAQEKLCKTCYTSHGSQTELTAAQWDEEVQQTDLVRFPANKQWPRLNIWHGSRAFSSSLIKRSLIVTNHLIWLYVHQFLVLFFFQCIWFDLPSSFHDIFYHQSESYKFQALLQAIA